MAIGILNIKEVTLTTKKYFRSFNRLFLLLSIAIRCRIGSAMARFRSYASKVVMNIEAVKLMCFKGCLLGKAYLMGRGSSQLRAFINSFKNDKIVLR